MPPPSPLPSVFPSIRVFSNELAFCIRWPKYWSFVNSLSNEYSGLISFRIDWFDILAIQGILKSLLQTTIRKYLFFGPQPSIPSYGKNPSSDYTELCQQCNVCFLLHYLVSHSFPSKEQISFNFITAVTVCSDFGA